MEIWKFIKGFEGFYQVSSLGNIRSLDRVVVDKNGRKMKYSGKNIKPNLNGRGYYSVMLGAKNGRREIHRHVAEAFIPNSNNLPVVNHKDGNKLNNSVNNLEWVNYPQNAIHALQTGLRTNFGEGHINSKLKEEDVFYIFEHFKKGDKEFGIKALANKFGVARIQIDKILRGERWKYLNLGKHPNM